MKIKYKTITSCLFAFLMFASQLSVAQEVAADIDPDKKNVKILTPMEEEALWKVTEAISTVSGEDLEKSFTQNVMNTLYGKIPGLTVMQGSGEPGSDSPGLYARGINTFDGISRAILIIVDGFETTMDHLIPQEIESISLLKDAAATALYGMRGANGVLLIKTKRGVVKPLQVNFSAQVGFQSPFKTPKFLDAYGYASLYNEALYNDYGDSRAPLYSGEALEAYKTGSNPYLYPNVDWQKEMLKNSSVLQNYNLNLSGGNETVTYFALLNVSDNKGLFKGTDSKAETSSNTSLTRYNIRGNMDINISKNFSAHLTLGANIQDQRGPKGGAGNYYNKIYNTPPNAFPIINPDGSYGGNGAYSNPVGDLKETGMDSYNTRTLQANLMLKEKLDMLTKGLSVSVAFSFNNYFIGNYNKSKLYPYFSLRANPDYNSSTGNAEEQYIYTQYSLQEAFKINDSGMDQWRNTTYQGAVDYSRLFNKVHQVDANVVLYMDETYTRYNNSDLTDRQFPYKHMGSRGRASYAYNQRYIGELAFSYEGSDLYARGNRYGFFPAGSLGWIVSNEAFMKNQNVVDFLKLRASYGLAGSSPVVDKRYNYQQDYRYTASYFLGENNTSWGGLMEGPIADLSRTWEKEKRFNIGIEGTLFRGLDFSFDYFHHNRYDILVNPGSEIPGLLGLELAMMNLGEATNKGFEATLGYSNKTAGGFQYYVRSNLWFSENKIDYMAEQLRNYDYQIQTGRRIGTPFGLVALGLFKDEQDILDSPEQTFGVVKPGDIKYLDKNDDGVIDNQDACPIGDTGVPAYSGSLTLGFKYKGFDFEAMFYGVGNRSTYLSGNTYLAFQNQYTAPESALDRWTSETAETAIYPRLTTEANPNNSQYSSFFLVNGSFLKLRYAELGYSLPKNISKVVYMNDVRFFLNGTNLFSLHHLGKYKNADPEGLGGYPTMRTISLGVKVQF